MINDKEINKRMKSRKAKWDKQRKKINEFVSYLFNEQEGLISITILTTSRKKSKWEKKRKESRVNGLSFRRQDFIKKGETK